MHYFRIATIVIFLISLVLYGVVRFYYSREKDTTPPTISSDSDMLELSATDPRETLLSGLTATDDRDGDITNKLIVSDESFFYAPGECTVKYIVFDAAHNYATYSRKVRYTDYTSPRIELTEPLVYTVGSNMDLMENITATDLLDGDITGKIRLYASSVSNFAEDVYPIEAEVTNSHGDRSSVVLNVVVRSGSEWPQVKLSDYVVYLEQGAEFDPLSLITQVVTSGGKAVDRDKCDIKVNGLLDTSKPGSYTLAYTVGTADPIDGTYLTVVVEDSADEE